MSADARAELEEVLREHLARLDEAQAIAHLGSWEWDVRRDVVSWSDEMFRIYGLEPQSVAVDYTRFLDFVHPDDREPVDSVIQHAFENASDFEFEHRIVRADETVRILHARGQAIADESGSVVRMVGTGHDITDQRLAQEQATAAAAAIAAAERIGDLQLITEAALSHLALDDLLPELLNRICHALDIDNAAVLLIDDDRETLVLRAARGLGSDEVGYRLPVGAGFAGRVAAGRKTIVIGEHAHNQVASPALKQAWIQSVAGVPLLVRDEVLGVLHVASRQARRFTPDEIALIELAAERAALAIDHSRVFERERSVAETLQRALLPARLPPLESLTAAVRYVPAGEAVDIGGDWYDVIPLPNGDVGLVLGDVAGHGLEAAALMAQLRHGLRAYALENLSPGEVAHRLDTLIHTPDLERLATLVYVIIDPRLHVRYVNAGHVPPIVVAADGRSRLFEAGRGLPVGVMTGAAYWTERDELEADDVLILYSDGLVERRGDSIDDGIEQLRRAAASGPRDPHQLVDHILRELLPPEGGDDDIALLAVRPADVARDLG